MKKTVLILSMVLISCTSLSPQRKVASTNSPENFPEEQQLTFPKLVEILKTNQVSTVADMLKVLKPRYPEYLKQRTAMYVSESIQEATFQEPRIIVFGPDAKFVFTFNGGPSHIGGSSVETFQFDDEKKEFNFFEIIFKKEMKSKHSLLKGEIDFENQQIIVSKANPVKCMDCHGYVGTAPIWDNGLNWVGAYGSNDDLLFGSFKKDSYANHGRYEYLVDLKYPRSQGRWIDLPEGAVDRELNGYIQYLTSLSRHPRYQHLPPQIFEAGFRKFASGQTIDEIDESETIRTEAKALGVSEPDRINLQFTSLLGELNMERLISDIKSRPAVQELLKKTIVFNLTDYPFYAGETRIQLFEEMDSKIKEKIDSHLLDEMNKKIGTFKNYYHRILREELEFQDFIVQRAEKDLQTKVIVHPKWPRSDGEGVAEVVAEYSKILGRRLTRTEIIAIGAEAGPLPDIAWLSYVLKFGGLNLNDYDINNHVYPSGRKRIHSFTDLRLSVVYRYIQSLQENPK